MMSKRLPAKIISNTKALQAIQVGNNLMAVFYVPGDLKLIDKTVIRANKPCLVITTIDKKKTWYSIPNERVGTILWDENDKTVLEYITTK